MLARNRLLVCLFFQGANILKNIVERTYNRFSVFCMSRFGKFTIIISCMKNVNCNFKRNTYNRTKMENSLYSLFSPRKIGIRMCIVRKIPYKKWELIVHLGNNFENPLKK